MAALTTVDTEGLPGGDGGVAESIADAIGELQGLKFLFIAGGSAGGSGFTATGLKMADTVVSVARFDVAVDTGTSATGNKIAGVSDLTAEATVPTDDHLRLASTDTTGDTLMIVFFHHPAE